ncbi:uncharacterized protein LOC125768884 isoform X2 [Anopheles funestus]|uniref:uncharacterized protein LOC125768884 isoform X2 n=1 Tax=Anopheles funestus TaxID=62324 RepID=UPI0020C6E1B8|nr:uncharacterized protein LOC125768884 isoform X2 [Anopheles funestus]
MADLKRARKSGIFYRRAAKYMKIDPSEKDEQEAGPSQTNPEELSSNSVEDEACVPGPNLNQDEEDIEELIDYTYADDSSSEDGDPDTNDSDAVFPNIENMPLIDGIRYWALSTNAPHSSVNIILKLFKKANVKVPLNAKTLLRTKRNPSSEITEIGGGQMWYRGIGKCLLNYFRFNKISTNELSLTMSFDGLPLHNSSKMEFWPILFTIYELPQAPVMTVAIYCGAGKPTSVEDYLRPMVEELNNLMTHGISINGEHVIVKLRVIVADTPARCFIKGKLLL